MTPLLFRLSAQRYAHLTSLTIGALLTLAIPVHLCAQSGPERGVVTGLVTDAVSGAPVVGADVVVQLGTQRLGTVVTSDGGFRLERVPLGRGWIHVRRIGYRRDSLPVTVDAVTPARVDVRLVRADRQLAEVRVKGEVVESRRAPITLHEVDSRTIKQQHQSDSPLKLVEQIPGIDVQSFNQGGVNSPFTIRGFESGGHGGDTYVALDGLLLNDQMYGAADVNMIIPLELDRVAVYKGPVSPLFGRFAKGGTFAFTTRKGGNYQDVQLQGGSYGVGDAQMAFGREFGAWRVNTAAQYFTDDSFRDATFYRKHNVAARIAYAPTPAREIGVTARTHRGRWNSAGYLTAEQAENAARRYRVNERATPPDPTDESVRAFDAVRVDASQALGRSTRLLAYVNGIRESVDQYYSYTTGEEQQAAYLTPRRQIAAGISLNGADSVRGRAATWVFGAEYLRERPDEYFATGVGRQPFAVYNDRSYTVGYAALFGQVDLDLHKRFRPSFGVRYDRFGGELTLRDPFETTVPLRLDMNAYTSVAPKLGVHSELARGIDLRANVSNGYDIPTGDLAFRQFGDVDPTQLWQYEAGLRIDRVRHLLLDLSAFQLTTINEITAVSNDPPRYENIGTTRRRGVEADLRWFALPTLEIRATSSVHRSEVTAANDPARVGLPVRLVPNGIHTLQLAFTPSAGLGWRAGLRNVGRYWTGVDDRFYAGYTTAEAGVHLARQLARGGRGTLFIDVRNLFDRRFASQAVRQFWSPAAPRTLQAGVTLER